MTKDSGFIVFLLIAVAAAALGGCAVNVPLTGKVKPLEEQVVSGEGTDKVLVIDISGIISDRKRKGPLRLSSRPSMLANTKEVLKKARHCQ
ncbi:MAG: hypothetical protein ACYSRP_05070 [Planctomycetota bacterium]|jgi:protease-4